MKGLVVVFATHFFPVSAPLHTPLRPGASLGNPPSPSSVAGPEHGGLLRVPEHYTPPFPVPLRENPAQMQRHKIRAREESTITKKRLCGNAEKTRFPRFCLFFFFQVNAFGGFFLPSTHHTDKMHEHDERRRTFLSRVFARLHNDATIYRRRPRRTRRRRP